tara:strand:+ start:3752 stop:3925 length:174 start_codon:yes stop_codon:yes gene_type:complete
MTFSKPLNTDKIITRAATVIEIPDNVILDIILTALFFLLVKKYLNAIINDSFKILFI